MQMLTVLLISLESQSFAIDSILERVGRGFLTNPLRIKLWADSSPKVCPQESPRLQTGECQGDK
jgi:hypothetical protein